MARWRSVAAIVLALATGSSGQAPVNCSTLVADMVSLQRLCRLPSLSHTSRQGASYSGYPRQDLTPDRASWWYDDDRGWFVRVDTAAGEWVMLDVDGPGAVERIWSANPQADTLEFYLDHSPTPTFASPMASLLDSGTLFPPPFAGQRARGYNLYFPLPYRHHCTVLLRTGNANQLYYHIGHRTYAPEVLVESFDTAALTRLAGDISRAAGVLADTSSWTAPLPTPALTRELILDPGATEALNLTNGPAAVMDLRFAVRSANPGAFVRGTALTITWDDVDTPQVDLPLGDFFGSSPHLTPYRTLPVAVLADSTLACRWVMPYRQEATITLANRGVWQGSVTASVVTQPLPWNDSSMYFHAYWRQDTAVRTEAKPEGAWFMVYPPRDHDFIHIRGTGLYVGTVLQIRSELNDWWGEGDERIYVDGDPFPAFMGTGTEDYFGYAYSTMTAFEHAYHAQPYSDGFRGFTTNLRWHIADPIPFASELRFDMEVQTAYTPSNLDYGRACFFYARPGVWTDHDGLDEEDLFMDARSTGTRRPLAASPPAAMSGRNSVRYDLAGRMLPAHGLDAAGVTVLRSRSAVPRAVLWVR